MTASTRKHIALVAHDRMKTEMTSWCATHREILARHDLYGTGTTGTLITDQTELPVHRFLSGPQGGDLQIGAAIAEGKIDLLVFFWDPLAAQPHEPDVRALLRVAVVWNIPCASNRASADLLVTSSFLA